MSTTPSPVQQGIELVKRATELDRLQKFNEAVHYYELSLQQFHAALEDPRTIQENRTLIETKIDEYDKRCNRLKELLLRQKYQVALHETLHTIVQNPNGLPDPTLSAPPSVSTMGLSGNAAGRPLPSRPSPTYVPNHLRPQGVSSNPGQIAAAPKAFSARSSDDSGNSSSSFSNGQRTSEPPLPAAAVAPIIPPRNSEGNNGKKFQLGFWMNKKNSVEVNTANELYQQAKEQESNPIAAMALYKQAAELMLKQNSSRHAHSNSHDRDRENKSEGTSSSGYEGKESPVSTPRGQKETLYINFENKSDIQLQEILGGGGSGAQIYKATYGGLTFAAKVMKGDMVPEMIDPIKREIHIMESIDNEHVVKYLGHHITESEIRLYMALYSSTLHDEINQRRKQKMPYKPAEICRFMTLITKGLSYLHSMNPPILHRDLKSENIFVQYDSRKEIDLLKIGDFDSSKILEGQRATFTRNMGTDGFMAPEVASNPAGKDKGYTKNADVWSLGMIMYELMMFEKPYFDVIPVNRHLVVVSGKRPTISPEVERKYKDLVHLWQKCTEKEPSRRPETRKILKALVEMQFGN